MSIYITKYKFYSTVKNIKLNKMCNNISHKSPNKINNIKSIRCNVSLGFRFLLMEYSEKDCYQDDAY